MVPGSHPEHVFLYDIIDVAWRRGIKPRSAILGRGRGTKSARLGPRGLWATPYDRVAFQGVGRKLNLVASRNLVKDVEKCIHHNLIYSVPALTS